MPYSPGCWHEAWTDPLTAAQTSQHWKPQRHQYWRTLIAALFTLTLLIYCRRLLSFLALASVDTLDFLICCYQFLSFPSCMSYNYSTFMICPSTMTSLSIKSLELPVILTVAIFKGLYYSTHNTIHSTTVIPVISTYCNSSQFLLPGPLCCLSRLFPVINAGSDTLKALIT